MPSLQILKGPNEGSVIPLEGDRFVLGRNPDCGIVIPVTSVSREHAQILRLQGKYWIEDKQSRNGTFVNNQAINTRTALKNNDRIRICDFIAAFLDKSQEIEEEELEKLEEHESGPLGVFAPLFRSAYRSTPADEAWLLGECRQIAGLLAQGHLCCAYGPEHYRLFHTAITTASSAARAILAAGFHRLVCFDVGAVVALRGEFHAEDFYGHAVERVAEAFGLRLERDAEPADVFQILRDEARSLLCFLDAERLPEKALYRIRSFTQDRHAVLLLRCHGWSQG
jgi:pSer/pThr/pTyr-binding forkhead associated (FHA) protein